MRIIRVSKKKVATDGCLVHSNRVLIPNITSVAEVVGGSELQLTCMPGVGAGARGSQFCINATIQGPGPAGGSFITTF